MPILITEKDDFERESDFELDYLLSLTTQERFKMMLDKSIMMAKLLEQNGHRKADKIIKRA
jgi:hypothetical protein